MTAPLAQLGRLGKRRRRLAREWRGPLFWSLWWLGLVAFLFVLLSGLRAESLLYLGIAGCYGLVVGLMVARATSRSWHRTLRRIEREIAHRLSTPATSSFSTDFFKLRLRQECHRSHRYRLPLSVLSVRLDPSAALVHNVSLDDISAALLTSTVRLLRTEDSVGQLGSLYYAVCLPHTDRSGAEVVRRRLEVDLDRLEAVFGMAVFDQDGADADSLLSAAYLDASHRLEARANSLTWNQEEIA